MTRDNLDTRRNTYIFRSILLFYNDVHCSSNFIYNIYHIFINIIPILFLIYKVKEYNLIMVKFLNLL